MLFHSLAFAVYFPIVIALILLTRRHLKVQNAMLLVASYVFYGWWDWRFLSLLFLSTAVDFWIGLVLDDAKTERGRKLAIAISVVVQSAILIIFKYYDFFAVSFGAAMASIGIAVHPVLLDLILPAGVSFYTFQTMSYTIDVYRRDLKAERNFIDFALFVTFFPQLIAGPIERATRLLPQFKVPRTLSMENVARGSYYFFWGLFLKVGIADNLAAIADPVFTATGPHDGVMVLIATYCFAFQIYCDFGGYSVMAIGIAMIMGFSLMENFRRPYFARNISDFWRRWHISLSTWFRDYVYIPLGGNRIGTPAGVFRNLMFTMLLAGLWHGANWTFAVFGGLHGLALWHYHMRRASWDRMPVALQMLATFHIVCLGWLFFRAQSVEQALDMLAAVATNFHPSLPHLTTFTRFLGFISVLLVMQVIKEYKSDTAILLRMPMPVRYAAYALIAALIISYGEFGDRPFIYFQF